MKNTKTLWLLIAITIGFVAVSCGNEETTPPLITTASLQGGTEGILYNQTLAATGDSPITWSIVSGDLPVGLSLSGNTISGTPSAIETATFTVKAENDGGEDTKELSIVISFNNARLVNAANEAWIDNAPAGGKEGFILNANGTYTAIEDSTGTWLANGTGTWMVAGTTLTLTGDGFYTGYGSITLSNSDNSLTWGTVYLTRESITISIAVNPTILVNAINEAWLDGYPEGDRDGFIINADGTYTAINDSTGAWLANGTGTWTVSGITLTLTGTGYYGGSSGTITLSSDNNTLTFDGETFTRTSSILLAIDPAHLINEVNEAWVDNAATGDRDGFILLGNGTYTAISDNSGGVWISGGIGTWAVSGNTLTLTGDGFYGDKSGAITLSNTNNTLTFDDNTTFTREPVTLIVPPHITTSLLSEGTLDTAFSHSLLATGTEPITWSIATGTLPAGLSLAGGVISGTPTQVGVSTFTVKAENAAAYHTREFTLAILCATHNFVFETLTATWCTAAGHGIGGTRESCQTTGCIATQNEDMTVPCLGTQSLTFTTSGAGVNQLRTVSGLVRTPVVCIPDLSDNIPVRAIANNVFGSSNAANADSILVSIQIGNNVTAIAANAFHNCSNLENVTIGSSVTSIGSSAFRYTKLNSITIPDNVTSVASSAFAYCEELTFAIIGEGVTSIGDYAFLNCIELATVTIGSNLKTIGIDAFRRNTTLTSVVLPNGLTGIGSGAFQDNSSLTSINIPSTVTTIGSAAFRYTKLTSVIIPNSVTSTIGSSTFAHCSELTSIVIGNGVTGIGDYAFLSCTKLATVTIGSNVKTIGIDSFRNTALTSVVLPDGLTGIGSGAFQDNSRLATVVVPSTVTSIGGSAFRNCPLLATVTIHAVTPPTLGTSAFAGTTPASMRIRVPSASVATYRATSPNWAPLADRIIAIP